MAAKLQRKYRVALEGTTDCLMHADNVKWRDLMEEWLRVPANKAASKAGDDRTPAWRWLGFAYHDGTVLGWPSDNLMTCMRGGGARVPTGKKGGTFKAQSQSGIIVNEFLWPIKIAGDVIPWAEVAKLREEEVFSVHEKTCSDMGFILWPKPASVGRAKHIRVRPRFSNWTIEGTVTIFDTAITEQVFTDIITNAGAYCGLGDWRPGGKTPGPFGKFIPTKIEEI